MTTTIELPIPVVTNTDTVTTISSSIGEKLLAPAPRMVPKGESGHAHAKPPLMIDRSEAYYWTTAWQEGVQEAVDALMAGKYRRFDSDDPLDLARWLLNEKED